MFGDKGGFLDFECGIVMRKVWYIMLYRGGLFIGFFFREDIFFFLSFR